MPSTATSDQENAVSTSAPERPEFAYLSDGSGTPPAVGAPAEARRPGRRRTTALLLCGALLCSGTGAVTALLVDDGPSPAAGGTGTARSGGTVQPASTTSDATPQTAAATIAPSVVTISVTTGGQGPFGGQASGSGSGIVLRSDGTIVTNNHVVAGATSVEVTTADGRSAPATVVGTDPSSDLAVVQAEGLSGLPAAVFADSDELAVGQAVLAVGAPLGLSNTVTEGIVSTLDRPVRTGDGASEQSVIDAVQTDAAINPGNSGGALVDLAGRVVGVPSAIATAGSGSSGNIGVGFAIPSNDAVEVAEQLLADGTADHPLLGVGVGERTGATAAGAVLTDVTASGPAAAAGLRPGDLVTQVGDRRVVDADSLIVAVRDHAPGDAVEVTYLRDGRERTTTATLTSTD
jgi:putative serine protease PepD